MSHYVKFSKPIDVGNVRVNGMYYRDGMSDLIFRSGRSQEIYVHKLFTNNGKEFVEAVLVKANTFPTTHWHHGQYLYVENEFEVDLDAANFLYELGSGIQNSLKDSPYMGVKFKRNTAFDW